MLLLLLLPERDEEDEEEDEPLFEEEDEEEPLPEEEDEDEEEEEDEPPPPPPPFGGACNAGACGTTLFGAFFRCSRNASVMPPKPIAVQKLIAKRVFFAVSFGKRPINDGCMFGATSLSRRVFNPMYSAISWKSTLIKMREEEVVSSSVITIYSITPHGSAFECNKCAKNLAMLRSLLVSRRWIIEYCLANASSNNAWNVFFMQQNRSPNEP